VALSRLLRLGAAALSRLLRLQTALVFSGLPRFLAARLTPPLRPQRVGGYCLCCASTVNTQSTPSQHPVNTSVNTTVNTFKK